VDFYLVVPDDIAADGGIATSVDVDAAGLGWLRR